MPRIDFELQGYQAGNPWGLTNGRHHIDVSLAELLHAAVTVGHPDYNTVLGGGSFAAMCEITWKATACLMTLRSQTVNLWRGNTERFMPTSRFLNLDPSEKRGATYQLGLTLTKLLARRLLGVPWLMHLDVYWQQLRPSLRPGRSRPDLVGSDLNSHWCVFESKGRASPPDLSAKAKAKDQASRVISIDGVAPSLCASMFGFFKYQSHHGQQILEAYSDDPPSDSNQNGDDREKPEPLSLLITEKELIQNYYRPFSLLFQEQRFSGEGNYFERKFQDFDFVVRLDQRILRFMEMQDFQQIRQLFLAKGATLARPDLREPAWDGIEIIPGPTWGKLIQIKE